MRSFGKLILKPNSPLRNTPLGTAVDSALMVPVQRAGAHRRPLGLRGLRHSVMRDVDGHDHCAQLAHVNGGSDDECHNRSAAAQRTVAPAAGARTRSGHGHGNAIDRTAAPSVGGRTNVCALARLHGEIAAGAQQCERFGGVDATVHISRFHGVFSAAVRFTVSG